MCTQVQANIFEWSNQGSKCKTQFETLHCVHICTKNGDAVHVVVILLWYAEPIMHGKSAAVSGFARDGFDLLIDPTARVGDVVYVISEFFGEQAA